MLSIQIPAQYAEELRWVSSIILSDRLGLGCEVVPSIDPEIAIHLDDKSLTLMSPFFSDGRVADGLPVGSMPALPLSEWDPVAVLPELTLLEPSLPVLFGRGAFDLDANGNGVLGLDVLGSAFFMLSRYEEIVLKDRDEHDRFPARASLAYKGGFLNRPLIDEYTEVLWHAMKRVWPGLKRRYRESRTVLSHDVDKPSLYAFRPALAVIRGSLSSLLKKKSSKSSIAGPWIRINSRKTLHPADPYNTFDLIMGLSEKSNIRSAFYFLSGCTHPCFDADYDLEHPAILALLRHIHQRGHEIGLHASYDTYRNGDVLSQEAKRLISTCERIGVTQSEWGGRMHYLRWEMPTTLYGYRQASISYDATVGFADSPGFRCGTCHEYPAFDPVARFEIGVRIRPLIAMDASVMAARYLGLGVTAEALRTFTKLKRACRAVNGDFTLLWHNSSLATQERVSLYKNIVEARSR